MPIEISRRSFLEAAATVPIWRVPMAHRRTGVGGSDERTHAVLWRTLDGSGMEQCRLSEREGHVTFDGGVVIAARGVPWRIEYEIDCVTTWETRDVVVRAHAGTESHGLTLHVDQAHRWTVQNEMRPDLHGCIDVDLGFSPSTNTLPIRRLQLRPHESKTIEAAWVEFPSLAVRRVTQRYTRTGEHTYQYENLATRFAATVDVDANGLVVSYPPGWERAGDRALADGPLFSSTPATELAEAARLYEKLIGSWDVEVIDYDPDGTKRAAQGEWHFGWALEGRAVLDVFIVPARARRTDPNLSKRGNRYGTTIRFYDARDQAWRIAFINPVTGAFNMLVARQDGDTIVHEGVNDDGAVLRWSFVEITRDRFHWTGEWSVDAGATWRKQAEFFGRRTSFAPLR